MFVNCVLDRDLTSRIYKQQLKQVSLSNKWANKLADISQKKNAEK